ncbi:ABC transporter ATP-binding protein [Flavobacteriales bacterium]|nr:ABC transporter ATP-binding protein [Flavobacteriales bacterium]
MSVSRIKIENLEKQYRLGEIGTGTLSHDLNRWLHKLRGKEDPYAKVGITNDRTSSQKSDYVWALKDINFEVEDGEVIGIIGKNGAGKSTLLKILSKVTGPTGGQIIINGRIAALLEVGTGMHPELTGRENIFLNGALLGMTKKEVANKFDEIVEFAGVGLYVDTPFKRYSSGMRVRLGFAVAAFLEPEILIVDEVLAVGDAEFQKRAIGKMKEVSDEKGRTVLFVSHNMNSVNTLCSRCIYLKDGKIKSIGETSKIVNEYLTNENKGLVSVDYKKAPVGDEIAKLLGARIINKDSITIEYAQIDENIGIEFTYKILKDGYSPIPNIHFNTVKGEHAFTAAESQKQENNKKGEYTIIAWVPRNLLNVETYLITVGLSTMAPVIIHFLEKDILILNTIENINIRKEGHNQNIKGVFRPQLNWTINKK